MQVFGNFCGMTKSVMIGLLAMFLAASVSWGQGDGSVENPWEIGWVLNAGGAASVTATLVHGVLTISGTGRMADYSSEASRPWHDDRDFITSVVIEEGVTTIGRSAFANTGLTSVTIGNSVTTIGSWAFQNCTGLTSVTIPNSVTSIGIGAFSGCTDLTSVTIGNSVTLIGNRAFENCTGLTSVTIGNSVQTIAFSAFSGCTGLTSVTIGNSVQTIEFSAFSGCTGLTEVTIPNSVTSIGNSAFSGCTGLTSVTSLGTTPITNLNANVFTNVTRAGQMTLKVPGPSIAAYENAPVWGTFQRIIGLFDVAELSISGPRKYKTHAAITATPAHERISIASIIWSPDENPFQINEVYTATVVLEVDGVNAIFTDNVTATVNEHTANVTERSATSITLTYTFPATEDREVTSISIVSAPTKMSYIHGEILELAGLVIKANYDNGDEVNRSFDEFLDYGGTINKANHTTLSTEHNGFVLKASIDGKEVTIGAITVTAQPVSIRQNETRDTRYGIILENAIATNAAKISVITPEPAQITLKILDNLGNVVHTVETQCLASQNCTAVWNLTNNAGRFVANGTYLIVVEARSANGRIYRYSAQIGVSR